MTCIIVNIVTVSPEFTLTFPTGISDQLPTGSLSGWCGSTLEQEKGFLCHVVCITKSERNSEIQMIYTQATKRMMKRMMKRKKMMMWT